MDESFMYIILCILAIFGYSEIEKISDKGNEKKRKKKNRRNISVEFGKLKITSSVSNDSEEMEQRCKKKSVKKKKRNSP